MLIRFCTICFLLTIITQTVNAQLCQGSLGDPIINITFGQGTNPGASLSAATTTYQYVANDCPNDGFYTVRNSTTSCFGNSWYSVNTDHTGDANGYFMLVNASIQPSAFYLDTVRGLCSNTTYELAAWILNVITPSSCNGNTIQPNLTFSIERTNGTILQTYNTGNIAALAAPAWKQYGVFFTTPVGASDIVLRIFNNSQGGCGNDLALDDITFRPCGPLITNAINGTTAPVNSIEYCEGPQRQAVLSCSVSGGFINPAYQWQYKLPNDNSWSDITLANSNTLNWTIPANAPPGIYQARLAVAEMGNLASPQCRIYSKPFSFTINANPVTTAANDGPACAGSVTILTATGGNQYVWTGPNSFTGSGSPLSLVNTQPVAAGKYYVQVTNAAGCINKDSTTILVNPTPIAAITSSTETICANDSVTLNASGGSSYLWIPATGLNDATVFNPKASPDQTTEYQVVVSNQFNCKDTVSAIVNVIQQPIVDAGPDKIILEGQTAQLTGTINSQGNNFSWSPATYIDNIHSLQPVVNPPVDTRYVLDVVSAFGCGIASDTVFVKVYKNIFIPSAFSPNGDGRNDTWNIPALAAYPYFEVAVYNRWGQMVFHTKSILKPWDGKFNGKDLPMGSYNYFIDVGESQYIFKGSVMIVR